MTEPYPIMEVAENAPEDIEQMGSKEKFWFHLGDERWLFKFPREGTGEHWAEKVVAEIGQLLGIPVARVELAQYKDRQGSATLSFADRAKGQSLIHGNELLAALVSGYEKDKRRRQSDHTLRRIVEAIRVLIRDPQRRASLEILASYLLLDALVGNVDRHHENWGFVVTSYDAGRVSRVDVAPSFDHASSLGRELLPDRIQAYLLDPEGIARYILRARGGIYIEPSDSRGASPLILAREAIKKYPRYFERWLPAFETLDMSRVKCIIERIPKHWMREDQRAFAVELIRTARNMLLENR